MPRIVKSGLIQASNAKSPEEPLQIVKQAMVEKHVAMIGQAAEQGVQVLCLQELFYGPYFCAEQDPLWYGTGERLPDGPSTALMMSLANTHTMVMAVPSYEEEMTGLYYDTASVFDAAGK